METCIKLASETKNEIPTTSIREIKILQNLDHSKIVSLREVVPSTGIAVCMAIDMCCRLYICRIIEAKTALSSKE